MSGSQASCSGVKKKKKSEEWLWMKRLSHRSEREILLVKVRRQRQVDIVLWALEWGLRTATPRRGEQ